MYPSELAAINGMPMDYRLDELGVVPVRWAETMADVVADRPLCSGTVRLTNASKTRGVGNGVVSSIAAAVLSWSSISSAPHLLSDVVETEVE